MVHGNAREFFSIPFVSDNTVRQVALHKPRTEEGIEMARKEKKVANTERKKTLLPPTSGT